MRIIILLIVFYFPCWDFAGGNACFPITPACGISGGGGVSVSPASLSADLSNAGALQRVYNLQTFTMINGLN